MSENISIHIQRDRIDRAAYIATTIGFGNIIKEKMYRDDRGRYFWRRLTDTGVIFVLNEEKTMIITLWIASVEQVNKMWGHDTPHWLYKVAKKNKKFMKIQDRA